MDYLINQEIEILSTLPKNNCFVEFLACYFDSDEKFVYVATELYDGDFSEESAVGKAFRESKDYRLKLRTYIRIIDCVFNLHQLKIMHNDLKPHNIVSKLADMSDIKIIDFGFATFPDQLAVGGTTPYLPPEYARIKFNILDVSGNDCTINRTPSIKRESYSLGKTMAIIELGKEVVMGELALPTKRPSNCFELSKLLRALHHRLMRVLSESSFDKNRPSIEAALLRTIRTMVKGIPDMRPNLPSIQYTLLKLHNEHFGPFEVRDELWLSAFLQKEHVNDTPAKKSSWFKI